MSRPWLAMVLMAIAICSGVTVRPWPIGIWAIETLYQSVHPVKDWYKVSIAQIPMGQGLTVTPLQMAMAISTIANHGRLMRPMLVDHLEDEHKQVPARYAPQTVRQAISEETARLMVQAMKKVVLPGGTAPKAALEHYTVAGKTGTGQKPPYGSHKYFSSFVGFFPADDPELCISVFIDEPDPRLYYGGETARSEERRVGK